MILNLLQFTYNFCKNRFYLIKSQTINPFLIVYSNYYILYATIRIFMNMYICTYVCATIPWFSVCSCRRVHPLAMSVPSAFLGRFRCANYEKVERMSPEWKIEIRQVRTWLTLVRRKRIISPSWYANGVASAFSTAFVLTSSSNVNLSGNGSNETATRRISKVFFRSPLFKFKISLPINILSIFNAKIST